MEQYKVGDLIIDAKKLNVLLVLESPHINEFIHKHPAAGEAACELTQFFTKQGYLTAFNNDLPIGCNIEQKKYVELGIMNCAHFPMNLAFYPCGLGQKAQKKAEELAEFRNELGQKLADEEWLAKLSQTQMFADFARRLNAVIQTPRDNPLIIIPCGFTATNFIELFQSKFQDSTATTGLTNQNYHILAPLPHPTQSDWSTTIQQILITKQVAKELLP